MRSVVALGGHGVGVATAAGAGRVVVGAGRVVGGATAVGGPAVVVGGAVVVETATVDAVAAAVETDGAAGEVALLDAQPASSANVVTTTRRCGVMILRRNGRR